MKRNMERSSGSSDEDKTSLKKPKKENAAKLKNAETEIGESIDGCKERVTNCKVEDPLLKVKRVCTENESDQKTINNKIGCNVNHKNNSSGKETENRNGEDIITEIKLVRTETFTNGRYKKYPNSCNADTKLENILEESVSNCDQDATDDSSRREETMINDQEYALLAEQLTDLFRGIYRDAMARNEEENSISKCQIRSKALDSVIKISNAKGESYLCNIRTNNHTSNIAEKNEGLEKEAKNYNSDNDVRNERLDESNNLNFREEATNSKSLIEISSEKCDRIVSEESNSSWNSEMNDEDFRKLSSNTYEEYGVQSGQTNRNRKGNSNAIENTDKFAKCQSNVNSHEECSTRGTSDEVSSSSTDVKMSDEEGKYSSGDAEYDRRCNELITADKIKRLKSEVENTRSKGDRSELNRGSDMSTDEDSWSEETKSAEENDCGKEESDNSSEEERGDDSTDGISDEETDSPGTEGSDNSSEEETDSPGTEGSDNSSEEDSDDNNTDQSSGEVSSSYGEENSETSSGEDNSTDNESSVGGSADMSTEEDSSNDSEYDNSEVIDENPEEDENTTYGEDIDSEREDTSSLSSGKSSKTKAITDDDSSTEIEYMSDAENIKNKRTTERVDEVNDESNSEGSRSSDDTGSLENLFDSVLGFASHRILSIATLGQDSITISLTRLKLMPFKDYFRKSVDGRHKKRNVANRKGNIITPLVRGNSRGEKTEKRGRNTVPDKVSVKNKAAEVSDAEEETSDEEWQVKDSTSKKSRNKKGNKQIEYDSDHKDSESDEDYNEEDENSSEEAGENNGKGHEGEDEDIGEEDSYEDYEEEADNEFDEDDDEIEEEEGEDEEEYVEVDEQGDYDSEEEENGDENEEDIEEEEENQEYDDGNVTAQMENDSSEQNSDNDQWNSLAKSKTMTKKKAAKKQARGKTNLVKKKKDRGE